MTAEEEKYSFGSLLDELARWFHDRFMEAGIEIENILRQRYALDASVLASIVNSDDVEHFSCYSFSAISPMTIRPSGLSPAS
jgi:hypothetical protein